jgi:V-type H+-transporting ATPase subunit C
VADFSGKRQQLQQAQRVTAGNLTVKGLEGIVKKEHLVDTDYLTSVFVVIPEASLDAFYKEYERLIEWVVPRSAVTVVKESELALIRVIIFKRVLSEFKTVCRERKWTVREYSAEEGGAEGSGDQARAALKEATEKRHKALVRWCLINYSEVFQAWIHLKTIRVFVESVLRYGTVLTFFFLGIGPDLLFILIN